jgi:hypothetical protein
MFPDENGDPPADPTRQAAPLPREQASEADKDGATARAYGSAHTRLAARSAGTRNPAGRSPRPHSACARPGPAADTPGATPRPGSAARGSSVSSRPAPRSPSSATPPATPGSAAPPRPRSTRPARARTSAARPRRSATVVVLASGRVKVFSLTEEGVLQSVLRTAHHPRDHLDRHALGPVQPADLSPVCSARRGQ